MASWLAPIPLAACLMTSRLPCICLVLRCVTASRLACVCLTAWLTAPWLAPISLAPRLITARLSCIPLAAWLFPVRLTVLRISLHRLMACCSLLASSPAVLYFIIPIVHVSTS